eukprot:CAMPEP_0176125770 /NCGR_PEP_ID=MMETSP0120_2-20121206/63463_1 /TAXON_ID=160619 /ORGANISM="Kryptoperidinium foliaceum, Strain CCMP 1326" /LENGTH=96 /DNA_ID=CAMNT_0017460659 /DNA_START=137 /DNA_END=427 /DNA_ORIENTATION=+
MAAAPKAATPAKTSPQLMHVEYSFPFLSDCVDSSMFKRKGKNPAPAVPNAITKLVPRLRKQGGKTRVAMRGALAIQPVETSGKRTATTPQRKMVAM